MPLITFVIPCYNSAAYMGRCLASVVDVVEDVARELCAGEGGGLAETPAAGGGPAGAATPAPKGDGPAGTAASAAARLAEVLVIDDGSTDGGATLACARAWEAAHPGLVHAIHRENGGPGAAINAGLAAARGTYFKVVDSDDWLDAASLRRVLATLRELVAGARAKGRTEPSVDALICNYVYEYADGSPARPVRYAREFPQGRPFVWDEMLRPFPLWRYLMMHAAIFRTNLLRDAGLRLPAHTFYVDEIVIYVGLAHARTLMYLDADLYRYLIGRADQSVNEQIMAARSDQQVRVGRIKVDAVDVASLPSRAQRRYLTHDLTITMCFCTVFPTLAGRLDLRDDAWDHLRERDPRLWRRIRWSFIGWWCNLRSPLGVRAFTWGYRTVRDIFRFN